MTDDAQRWNGAGEELLRRLKGAPMSVFIALALYGQQARPELVRRTGWSRSAVSQALTDLVAMGLVQRNHFRGWAVRQDLEAALRAALWGHAGRAERMPGNRSTVEHGFGGDAAERLPENLWPFEGMLHSLWEHERLSDGFWAERLLENLSRRERFSGNPSAIRGQGYAPPERLPDIPSASERMPGNRSLPHDHDVDHHGSKIHDNHHDHDHHAPETDGETTRELQGHVLRALRQLDPPFDEAEAWLGHTPVDLVDAWLDHLQSMSRERRRLIRNEAAFVRAKVESGRFPPTGRRERQRRPCPDCGKTIRDAQGRCLVCAGIVMV